ncbi:MAG: PASTA domain-containing protein [Dictyoglomus thermophilum]|uniref:PASTA domain-containing protein n=1 Tax=Dictyoglomus thermophilum TaxID=14 RepID=A0A7C2H9K6_DICTH|nr:PASTA domain-containing protein [Dictyoglomus thermophilum]MCX7719933.1 PASTA domain-containing protein [Dictyoglomus thermophilum]TYT22619.1 PASTA domain-containing protein [Dictyoglomus thermophilum]
MKRWNIFRKLSIKELILYGLIFINLIILGLVIFFFQKTINNSPDLVFPPDVRGKDLKEATDILAKNNFKVVIEGVLIDKNKDPLVILDQNPLNTKIPSGSIISLWINMPQIVKIPNVIQKDTGEARNILEKLGLRVEVVNGENGYIVRQIPESDFFIEKGASIVLYSYVSQEQTFTSSTTEIYTGGQ